MNDIQLLRLCFVLAFLGLGALFVLSKTVEGEIVEISDITEEKIGQKVVVQGIVYDLRQLETMTLFSLQENEAQILIVSFSNVEVHEDDIVTVTGSVKEYKGELEVVASQIIYESAS
ncbi:MAG: OB-fold nucleic acid binding domain-containing protein [Nanoarchaeota archaeon]